MHNGAEKNTNGLMVFGAAMRDDERLGHGM
jgi:hypothetical protein